MATSPPPSPAVQATQRPQSLHHPPMAVDLYFIAVVRVRRQRVHAEGPRRWGHDRYFVHAGGPRFLGASLARGIPARPLATPAAARASTVVATGTSQRSALQNAQGHTLFLRAAPGHHIDIGSMNRACEARNIPVRTPRACFPITLGLCLPTQPAGVEDWRATQVCATCDAGPAYLALRSKARAL